VCYPKAFEVLWDQTGKRGGKFAALKAWRKVGQPTWDAIGSTWAAYLVSERPRAGYVKDLSSWLNGRCHEQDWAPAPRLGSIPKPPPDRLAERTDERLRAQREAVDYDKIPDMAALVAMRPGK